MQVYDVIIRKGILVDGSGAPPYRKDVGIIDDTIAKIGDLFGESAEEIINADDLFVAPGFIDIHNHSDSSIFIIPTADNYVTQGVTTIVVGNCGYSPAPLTENNREFLEYSEKKFIKEVGSIPWHSFSEYLKHLEVLEKSLNVVALVGHGTLRSAVLGVSEARPSEKQLSEMSDLLNEAMNAGAFGMSSGLIYVPGMFSDTRELIELTEIVSRYGGIYSTHIRNEGVGLIDAVIEAIQIGLASGVSLEISHVKAAGPPTWGSVPKVLSLIEEYVRRGYDFSADAYPYTASSTGLEALLPTWVRKGGPEKMIERLKNPDLLSELRNFLKRYGIPEEGHNDWDKIRISYSESHPEVLGRNIEEISRMWDSDPVSTIAKLLIEDKGLTSVVIHTMNNEDVTKAVSHPLVAIGSDGSVMRFGEGMPHPRNYGTFPRIIARYVRELKVLSLPEAVRKMTSLPARKLGLHDRGLLRPGFKADLVVFNYYTMRDKATFENPHTYSTGVEYLLINGKLVIKEGKHTGAKPGRLLRRS
ncbi:MAG: D-aminoacylase [Desulfurococcaceae archaeon TW002]